MISSLSILIIVFWTAGPLFGQGHATGLLLLELNESIVHPIGRNIRTLDLETGKKRNIPSTKGAQHARLSPDGVSLAFVREGQIVVSSMNGSAYHAYNVPQLLETDFEWDSGGSHLVMNYAVFDIIEGTYTYYAEDRGLITALAASDKIREDYHTTPGAYSVERRFSPDLKKAAIFGFNGDPYRLVILDGSTATIVAENTGGNIFPQWSRDGLLLAYSVKGDIVVFDTRNKSKIQLTKYFLKKRDYWLSGDGEAGGAVFSPDHKWVAFTKYSGESISKYLTGR